MHLDWLSEGSDELARRISPLYRLPPATVSKSNLFRNLLTDASFSKAVLLASIPTCNNQPYRPLHILYLIVTEVGGSWPPFALFYHFLRLRRRLPETGHQDEAEWLVQSAEGIVRESYGSLADFVAGADEAVLRTVRGDIFMTHRQLGRFVDGFGLPLVGTPESRTVVAVIIPDEPLMAAVCVAVATYYVVVPLSVEAELDQIEADLERVQANCVVTTPEVLQDGRLVRMRAWLERRQVAIFTTEKDTEERGRIVVRDQHLRPLSAVVPGSLRRNGPGDVAVMLFNKGIWGTRGLVSLTTHGLIREAIEVVEAWRLVPRDVCFNMAPVDDMGGLTRGVMAAIVSGGSVVCCSRTSPRLFWDALPELGLTWCLAPLTKLKLILAEAPFHPQTAWQNTLRLACRSDGFIPADMAALIEETFHCEIASADRSPVRPQLTLSHSAVGSLDEKDEARYAEESDEEESEKYSATTLTAYTTDWFSSGHDSHAKEKLDDYLDDDGYLRVMGASKEVIHSGKRTIDPQAVEEAIMTASESPDSPIHNRVAAVLAFSMAHETQGEAVAVVVVPSPEVLRVDLRTLHDALRASPLDDARWPHSIVYMSRLPMRRGKPLRARLGARLGLPELSDETPYAARHWEATCPPPDTSLMTPIEVLGCRVDVEAITDTLAAVAPSRFRVHVEECPEASGYDVFLAPESASAAGMLPPGGAEHFRRLMNASLVAEGHAGLPGNLHILDDPLPLGKDGVPDRARLAAMQAELHRDMLPTPVRHAEDRVERVFTEVLGRGPYHAPLDRDAGFYRIGGDSRKAKLLLAALRVDFNLPLPADLLTPPRTGSVRAVAAFVEARMRDEQAAPRGHGCTETYSSTRPWLLILQLVPLVFLYPLLLTMGASFQMFILSKTRFWRTVELVGGRLANLLVSLMTTWITLQIIIPWFGIAAKWLIIGRYREGVYPMWGPYHTRWWMVQKIVMVCGMGIFDISDKGRILYHRLMGAKIGRDVQISDVILGEWDLLDIRDGARLERCHCRPFAAEENSSMYLGRIVIGERASVGLMSVLAPGTEVLPDTRIGANSSSWEQADSWSGSTPGPAGTWPDVEAGAETAPPIPEPHWLLTLLLTMPIYLIGWFISMLPWLVVLIGMLYQPPKRSTIPVRVIADYYQSSPAIAYNYLSDGSSVAFSPLLFFLFAVGVRAITRAIAGDLPTKSAEIRSSLHAWRITLIRTLFPEKQLTALNDMLGHHNEARSGVLRMLGARVGRRVCWPTVGPVVRDYHLVDIGDDVTFGESCFLETYEDGDSGVITIGNGAVISDHVCIMPGVSVGERTTLGFGTLTRRGRHYQSGKAFIGCRAGDAARSHSVGGGILWPVPDGFGRLRHADSAETLVPSNTTTPIGSIPSSSRSSVTPENSPYNRAVYMNDASYRVLSPTMTLIFSFSMTLFTTFYWNVAALSSMKLACRFFVQFFLGIDSAYDILVIFGLDFACSMVLLTTFSVLALGAVILSKRLLIGKYEPGVYDWDKSPMCQRWQLLTAIEKITRRCYVDKGILSMLTGTHWLVLYYRALGVKIGKDCSLFANGYPSLLITAADLVEIGDRVVLDDVGLISHMDRRGSVRLGRIKIGHRCVLRTGSNILYGAEMKDESCLLEHTLVLPGEVVKEKWTMQRRPAERFYGSRKGT
ncbi:hypothetical protein CDD80_3105 [Ophiocordyceps camponoti-rufipedis]|uniref:Carrier domain-containing protein n=1 Tax=Ophiocordyceps camponoti-rufipedis TaxID=2004952 RepID=A0A2C5Z3N6_9HYPO|nr:hypothetical protein CDD80_3105 [Ophiocordyceps camponoti-rufipedis]